VNAPRFREQDIPIAITTLIQVLVVQLLDSDVLTVEQAEQVFDGAAKRSACLKEAAPDAQRLIQHLHDELNWDKYYKLAANRRRLRKERDL
jgi:HEAT repeat protein